MAEPVPGVLYQRHHPDKVWRAKGRVPIGGELLPSVSLLPSLSLLPQGVN